MKKDKILVLGIGNVLMGDEGVGVHAIRFLEKKTYDEDIVLLDGGTGGFHLLTELANYRKVIMIDATLDQNPVGTLSVIRPRYSSDFPPALSAHDVGLKDLVEALHLTGLMPKIYLITVSVSPDQELGMELSPPVAGKLSLIAERVDALIRRLKEEKDNPGDTVE